ncbi:MAG TPA: hypothetical protein VG371_14440 [Solirubrobacteraceae bacterium]|jgi:hypothetical protein|nr:hypothetical protein [Solirubrobacteraceae bacterium]
MKAPLLIRPGEEWLRAQCTVCGRTWEAVGTVNSRRAIAAAQRHADRTGHVIDAQHANVK